MTTEPSRFFVLLLAALGFGCGQDATHQQIGQKAESTQTPNRSSEAPDVSYPATVEPITFDQLEQLESITPSTDGTMKYRPSRVTLNDGSVIDRVYVVEAASFKRMWGGWPSEDQAKQFISITDVQKIEESPVRLPVAFANRLYVAGESGQGYAVFYVVLSDGRKLPFVTGNAVDFPNWPAGVTPKMVTDVLPHEAREEFRNRPPDDHEKEALYRWCLYLPGWFHR